MSNDTATTTIREVEGLQLPQPGTFDVDVAHSHVGFVVRHMMVSKVRGSFPLFTGTIVVGETPQDSRVDVSIDAASVDTKDENRDAHLRSPDFFDTDRHPTWSFRSTRVVPTGGGRFDLEGDLTLHGVTRPITLAVEQAGVVTDTYGNERIGFSASADLDREDWGITFNMALEAGGVVVGKTVKLEIEVEAVRSQAA